MLIKMPKTIPFKKSRIPPNFLKCQNDVNRMVKWYKSAACLTKTHHILDIISYRPFFIFEHTRNLFFSDTLIMQV